MLVVDPSSSRCDICLDPFEWNSTDRTPHIINCGHVFCAECLHQVFPTRCPLCRELFEPSEVRKLYVEPSEVRKLYVEPSEIRKLHVESCSDDDKEEVILLKQLISVHDSSEEEILRLRIRVDTWLAARTLDEVCADSEML
ncbi:hypothetical protein GGU10DRAFT_270719 [Lentinula aff. detonsa]|uniref:RING-type domain-containing protein n=1 Tax=Lentinula aff. detonsa TaxID=2804958 RepID=A0AA38KFW1_9AGAR|nr:hypothetical protein GGU10DRAFT_270719 [Lentinula aff. detonsa]